MALLVAIIMSPGSSSAPLLCQISPFVSSCIACNACLDVISGGGAILALLVAIIISPCLSSTPLLCHISHIVSSCVACNACSDVVATSGGGANLALLVVIIILLNSMALPCRSTNFPTSGAAFNVHIHSLCYDFLSFYPFTCLSRTVLSKPPFVLLVSLTTSPSFHYHTSLLHHLLTWFPFILIPDPDSLCLPSYLLISDILNDTQTRCGRPFPGLSCI